jgi:hypothetical protein
MGEKNKHIADCQMRNAEPFKWQIADGKWRMVNNKKLSAISH